MMFDTHGGHILNTSVMHVQDSRRSGSFTFATVSPRSNALAEPPIRRRATTSEPCEVLTPPKTDNAGAVALRHVSSLPAEKVRGLCELSFPLYELSTLH